MHTDWISTCILHPTWTHLYSSIDFMQRLRSSCALRKLHRASQLTAGARRSRRIKLTCVVFFKSSLSTSEEYIWKWLILSCKASINWAIKGISAEIKNTDSFSLIFCITHQDVRSFMRGSSLLRVVLRLFSSDIRSFRGRTQWTITEEVVKWTNYIQ